MQQKKPATLPTTFKDLSNPATLFPYQTKISELFNEKLKNEACNYLYNITNLLKSNKQCELKFVLEIYYLKQLATHFPLETPVYFLDFLTQAFANLNKRIANEPNYFQDFCFFLLQEVLVLGDLLGERHFQSAVALYKHAINFFVSNNCIYANPLVLKAGELLSSNRQNENAIELYKSVFLNLFTLALKTVYIPSEVDLKQLQTTLENLCSFPLESVRIYQILQRLVETFDPALIDELIQTMDIGSPESKKEGTSKHKRKCPDYNLYMHVHYILTFLYLTRRKSAELLPAPFITALDQSKFHDFVMTLRQSTSIFKAIDQDDEKKLQDLINAKIILTITNREGATPLQYALLQSKLKAVEILAYADVNLDETDMSKGESSLRPPLYLAMDCSIEAVKLLLNRGAMVSSPSNSKLPSPLFYAINTGKKEIAKELLSYWAKVSSSEFEALNKSSHPQHKLFKELLNTQTWAKVHAFTNKEVSNSCLYPLHSHHDLKSVKTPLFCVYDLLASEKTYRAISQQFELVEPDRPVYLIVPPSLVNEKAEPLNTIEEKAQHCIEVVRSRQAVGPYIFLGSSLGGQIAYEIALNLKEKGEEVIIVAMFDTTAPLLTQQINQTRYALHLLKVTQMLLPVFKKVVPGYEPPTLDQLKILPKEEQIKALFPPPDEIRNKDRSLSMLLRTIQSNLSAVLKYNPAIPKHPPVVTCFNTDETCREYGEDDLGWRQQTKNNVVLKVLQNANHSSIMQDEVAREIVEFISAHVLIKLADTHSMYLFSLRAYSQGVDLYQICKDNQKELTRLYGPGFDQNVLGKKPATHMPFFEDSIKKRLSETDLSEKSILTEDSKTSYISPTQP